MVRPISRRVRDSGRPLANISGVSGEVAAEEDAKMASEYITVKVDGAKWNIHAEDFVWAADKVIEAGCDISFKHVGGDSEFDRRVVALCHGWGRRIAPALS